MSWPLADAASWAPLPANRNRVLVALCFIANGNGNGRVWVGEERLAARLRITPRRVRAHLDALERDGWLRIVSPHAPGRATTRELNCARILEAARQERDRFEAHRRPHHASAPDEHRTAASGVPEATPDSSVQCTPDISDANTGRQRPKNQERTKSIRTTTRASASPAPDPPKAPTVAELVDQYRALPGILRSHRDGSRFAWLVNTFPAAEVRAALVKHGPTLAIRARKDPIDLLHSIIKNERTAETSAQASFRRTEAVRDSLDRVVVGRLAETEAVWDEVRASLGIQNGNSAADTDKATISAADAAKRAGMALIGDHLPPMPQCIPEEAAPA